MSLIAEFRLASPDIALLGALSAVPEMTLHVEQTVAEDPEQPVMFAWVSGDDFERFERAVEQDPTISEIDLLQDLSEERLYRVRISEDATVVFYALDVEVGTSRLDITATHEGLEVRMRFPDQDSLQEYFERCREHGVTVSLQRLYRDQTGDDDGQPYELSPKQRTALEEAYRLGFFDVPRSVSLSEVADTLEVSEQAVSERLRRATGALVEQTLAPEEEEETNVEEE
ncbi:MAG: helix-turn-helix domain-containing protein [Haloferacaceae archaeon]